MSYKIKYVAEGFTEDAGRLMADFIDCNSVDFKDFATIWRKHQFSLIFMGRPDATETCEFVNEMFCLTSQYLFMESFHQQVGGVYMLYALYRNQISDPPIKIRIELRHLNVVKYLREEAINKPIVTLHYVIDYLMKHAFLYVASQVLWGPLTGYLSDKRVLDVEVFKVKENCKEDFLVYSTNNNLSHLQELQKQMLDERKKIFDASETTPISNVFDEALKGLEELKAYVKEKEENDKLCAERWQNYKKESRSRKDRPSGSKAGPLNVEIKPVRRRKEDRRLGRPRMKPKISKTEVSASDDDDEDEIDISHLLEQQKDFYLPPETSRSRKDGPSRSKAGPSNVEKKPVRMLKEDSRLGRPRMKPQISETEVSTSDDDDEIDISHLLEQQKDFYLPPETSGNSKIRTRRIFYNDLSSK